MVRKNTYTEILNNVGHIPIFARLSIPCGLTTNDDEQIAPVISKIQESTNNYKEDVETITLGIRQLEKLLLDAESRINDAFDTAREEQKEEYREKIKLAHKEINTKFRFDIYRTVLMPRVLDFSENKKLLDALITIEASFKTYDDLMNNRTDISTNLIFSPLIDLLEGAADVYTYIADDLKKEF